MNMMNLGIDMAIARFLQKKRINDFIKDKKVIDIKYQVNISSYANESFHDTDELERALIMYEEHENED